MDRKVIKGTSSNPTPINRRRDHNTELLQRMSHGDPLCAMDSTSSWFPPRPVIAKDRQAILRLYGPQARPMCEKTSANLTVASGSNETEGDLQHSPSSSEKSPA